MALYGQDPPDALGDNATLGYLRMAGPIVGIIGQEIQLMFEWARRDHKDSANYDRFLRVSAAARLPNFAVQELPPQLQAQLIAQQVCPVPSSYVDTKRAQLAGIADTEPPVAPLLREWFTADRQNKALRKVKREAVGTHVESHLDAASVPAHYRNSVYTSVRAQMHAKELTIGDTTLSYIQWYRAVAAETLDELRELQIARPATAPKEENDPLLRAFSRAGIGPDGDFLYTLSFNSKSQDMHALKEKAMSEAPKVDLERPGRALFAGPVPMTGLHKSGGLKNPLQVLKLKGGLFKLAIKKEKVTLTRSADGSLTLKDGEPVIAARSTVWDTASGGAANALGDGFVGVFGEFGAGLSFEGKTGKASAGSGLSDISMLSALDLTKEDFAWAQLSSVFLAGPKVKLGEYLSLDVFSSRLLQIDLTSASGGFSLSATQTTGVKAKLLELGDMMPDLPTDIKTVLSDYDKKWTRPQVEARILEVSTSRAIIMPLFNVNLKMAASDPLPRPKATTDTKFASWFVEAFFALNSADLDVAGPKGSLAGGTPRDQLEVHLATYRAFLASETSALEICGMTSPEQPAPENLQLSQRRASAVRQAITDALGGVMRANVNSVRGVGERAALGAGMTDPESVPLSRAQFIAKYPAQVLEWPYWRRTDVLIDDTVVLRVQAH